MKRQITIGIAIVAAVTVALGFVKYLQISAAMAQHASMKMPPAAVTTQIAKAEVWPDTIEAVGSLTAVQGVVLKADTQGVVTNVAFESGASVPAGAIILEVDSSVEAGKLKAARAMRDQAQRTYVRNQKLISESAMSKADLESAEAAYRSAEGEVAALEAQIAKKQIQAPFAGKLGVRRVNIGAYVSPGDVIIPLFDDSQLYASCAQHCGHE